MLHGDDNIEMDTTRGHVKKFLKIHTIHLSDTRVGYVLDMTQVHSRSARAT